MSEGRVITGSTLERAENIIKTLYNVGPGDVGMVLDTAHTDHAAFESYIDSYAAPFFKHFIPDVDPRHEPTFLTMMLHFYAMGVTAERVLRGDFGA